MAQQDNAARIAEAKKQAKDQPQKAEQTFKSVLEQGPGKSDAAARDYENALMGLGELYRDQRRTNDLAELVQQIKGVLSSLAKAKTAKLGVYLPIVRLFSSHNLTHSCFSAPTARPLHSHPRFARNTDHRHKVMYRLGCSRTSWFPSPEPRDTAGVVVHAKAELLRVHYPHQPSAQGVEAS